MPITKFFLFCHPNLHIKQWRIPKKFIEIYLLEISRYSLNSRCLPSSRVVAILAIFLGSRSAVFSLQKARNVPPFFWFCTALPKQRNLVPGASRLKNDQRIELKWLLDPSFAAVYKVRTFRNVFISLLILLWYGLRHMHVQGIKFVWLAELKLTEEGQTSAFLWRI